MNDDRLKEYMQHMQAKDDAQSKVGELETNKGSIESQLRSQETDTPEGQKKFEELRHEQDANESNLYDAREDLSSKENTLESFKEENKAGTHLDGEEMTQAKFDTFKAMEGNEHATQFNQQDMNGPDQVNDIRVSELNENALREAQGHGQDLHQQGIEAQEQNDMER